MAFYSMVSKRLVRVAGGHRRCSGKIDTQRGNSVGWRLVHMLDVALHLQFDAGLVRRPAKLTRLENRM